MLRATWGKAQGFDAIPWLDMYRATHWFEPLPDPRSLLASYHPPLSYLLVRLINGVVPDAIAASQVLSSAAMLAAFFGFRHVLKRTRCLESTAGLWLLYGGFSLPLYVWLAIETGYDSLIFAWFILTLSVSVALFWHELPGKFYQNTRVMLGLVTLVVLLVAGLYTKYSGLMAFALPFMIIWVRRGLKALAREAHLPALAAVVALAIIAPFYHARYYETEHEWMPAAMEWQKSNALTIVRTERDADPLEFFAHMIRVPSESIVGANKPVRDSFLHSIWFHVWKRDKWLGVQPKPSLTVSNAYVRFFAYATLVGSLVFLGRLRRRPRAWRQLGWVLLGVTAMFSAAALAFAWKYPIWGWRVFKAKYMAAGILWVAYAAWAPFDLVRSKLRRATARRIFEWTACVVLVAFMMVNHLLPVY